MAAGPATETLARELGKDPQEDLWYRFEGQDDPLRLWEQGKRRKAERVAKKAKAKLLADLAIDPRERIDDGRKPEPTPQREHLRDLLARAHPNSAIARHARRDWAEVHTSLALAPSTTKLHIGDPHGPALGVAA